MSVLEGLLIFVALSAIAVVCALIWISSRTASKVTDLEPDYDLITWILLDGPMTMSEILQAYRQEHPENDAFETSIFLVTMLPFLVREGVLLDSSSQRDEEEPEYSLAPKYISLAQARKQGRVQRQKIAN
jgi:hypothetical protein